MTQIKYTNNNSILIFFEFRFFEFRFFEFRFFEFSKIEFYIL